MFFDLKRNILQLQVGLFSLDQALEHAEANQSKSTMADNMADFSVHLDSPSVSNLANLGPNHHPASSLE